MKQWKKLNINKKKRENEYEEIRLEIVTIFQRGRTLNKIHCILHPYKFTTDLEIIDMLSKAVKYIVLASLFCWSLNLR